MNRTIPLRLTWQPLSMIKWQVYAAQSMKNQWAQGGPLGSLLYGEVNDEVMDEEQDSLKEAMLDTNPYLLGMTFVVSVVHSIFEFLAFKNGLSALRICLTIFRLILSYLHILDIQFWRQRESLEGLSVRSVFFNVFQSLIVLLYVLDNETNMMIRISCFIGLGIEVWKIHKVTTQRLCTFMRAGINYEYTIFGHIRWLTSRLTVRIPSGVFSLFVLLIKVPTSTLTPRNTMHWHSSICRGSSILFLLDMQYIHSCMKNTKAGTHGFSPCSTDFY